MSIRNVLRGALAVSAIWAMGVGCASSREQRIEKLSEKSAERETLVEELSLRFREQITLAEMAAQRSPDSIVRSHAKDLAQAYQQIQGSLDRWSSDRTREMAALDLSVPYSGVGGSGQVSDPDQLAKVNSQIHNDRLGTTIKASRDRVLELSSTGADRFDQRFLELTRDNSREIQKRLHDGSETYSSDGVFVATLVQNEALLQGHEETNDRLQTYLKR